MRTELTYAVDQMARYNGEYKPAYYNVSDYHAQGGLSQEYYSKVLIFMSWVDLANKGQLEFVPAKWRKRLTKAMRKKMPRVHTEVNNWRLNYWCAMRDVALGREQGKYDWARGDLRQARHIRQMYL